MTSFYTFTTSSTGVNLHSFRVLVLLSLHAPPNASPAGSLRRPTLGRPPSAVPLVVGRLRRPTKKNIVRGGTFFKNIDPIQWGGGFHFSTTETVAWNPLSTNNARSHTQLLVLHDQASHTFTRRRVSWKPIPHPVGANTTLCARN